MFVAHCTAKQTISYVAGHGIKQWRYSGGAAKLSLITVRGTVLTLSNPLLTA